MNMPLKNFRERCIENDTSIVFVLCSIHMPSIA